MSAGPSCLVRGSLNIDEFFALPHIVKPGETISSTRFDRKAGGKGANQAFSLARAGGKVELMGCLGNDGVWVKELLEGGGVGVEGVRVVDDEPSGRAIIQLSEDGENSIVLYKGANFSPHPSDSPPNLSNHTHLLLQNEIPLPTTLSFLQSAGQKGVKTIFNPSPMLTPTQLQSFPWSDLSWLIVNEGELEALLIAFGSAERIPSQGGVIEKAKQEIPALLENRYFDPKVSVICTLGAQGILYTETSGNGNELIHLPAARLKGPVKDTTGAGDCFAGYFVAGLMAAEMEGKGEEALEGILRVCLTACAMCVEKEGAMESVPLREEVLARMSG